MTFTIFFLIKKRNHMMMIGQIWIGRKNNIFFFESAEIRDSDACNPIKDELQFSAILKKKNVILSVYSNMPNTTTDNFSNRFCCEQCNIE